MSPRASEAILILYAALNCTIEYHAALRHHVEMAAINSAHSARRSTCCLN